MHLFQHLCFAMLGQIKHAKQRSTDNEDKSCQSGKSSNSATLPNSDNFVKLSLSNYVTLQNSARIIYVEFGNVDFKLQSGKFVEDRE